MDLKIFVHFAISLIQLGCVLLMVTLCGANIGVGGWVGGAGGTSVLSGDLSGRFSCQ